MLRSFAHKWNAISLIGQTLTFISILKEGGILISKQEDLIRLFCEALRCFYYFIYLLSSKLNLILGNENVQKVKCT